MFNLSFHVIAEGIAFLAACIWGRFGERYFRLFIPFLFYTVVNEYAGWYAHNYLRQPNFFLYNIYTPIEFAFYSLQVIHVFHCGTRKWIALTMLLIGFCFSIWNIVLGQGLNEQFNTNTNLLLSILLIILSLLYLYNLLTLNDHVKTPLEEPMFWIIAGLLFFNFGWLVINALYHYADTYHLTFLGDEIYPQIMKLLNLLMYSCFTISFVLCYRNRKSIC